MTGLERIRRAVRFEPTDRVPVVPLLGAHAATLAGIPHQRACRDPAAQAEALLAAVHAYRPDAIFTLMDLTAEPEALGAAVEVRPGQPPVVTGYLPREALDTDALERRILTARVPVFVETVSRLRKSLGDSVLVGALICGPLTAAANALGIETLSRMLRRDRDLLSRLLDRLGAAVTALLQRHADAGAHAVMLLEPVATTAILGRRDLEALLLPSLRDINRAAREAAVLSMLHICGDCRASLSLLGDSGADVLSLDSPVDLPAAKDAIGRSAALMGNLDVRRLLPCGSPASVYDSARDLVSAMGRSGGFILGTGCELPADTPRENVARLLAAARP